MPVENTSIPFSFVLFCIFLKYMCCKLCSLTQVEDGKLHKALSSGIWLVNMKIKEPSKY